MDSGKGVSSDSILVELPWHPLLLPKQNKLTDIIIEHCHKKALHAGVAQTLGSVRQTYWVPHGRSVVKRVLLKCKVLRAGFAF